MTEVLLPTWIVPEEETHEWLDEGSAVFNSAFAPGIAQRQSFGGLRLKMSRRHTVRAEEKAQLLSILQATRGRFNALRTKVHFERRGSGFGSELMTDTDFSDWTSNTTTETTVSVNDRVLRALRVANTATSPTVLSAEYTGTQYAPVVGRVWVKSGRGPILWDARVRNSAGTVWATSSTSLTAEGYQAFAGVSNDSSYILGIVDRATGKLAGDYMGLWYGSITRPALVDTGLNSLLQSDELDTSWTATRASVDDQTASTTAPDGTSTADSIIEDTSAATSHFISQGVTVGATAADYAFSVAVKAGARTWVRISMRESTSSHEAIAYLNLSSGAVGTVTTNGANWENQRAFVQSLGDGWYKFSLVAKKVSAGTTVTALIYIAEGDNDITFTGDGTSNIYAWRATLVQSSVPTRLVQTTTTASTGTAPASGATAMYVKGLPASTNGLLLPGDWFEINGELKQCSAPLNSDAAGLGYLQFEPPLVRAPANDDPVIVTDPMGKFLVSNIQIQNQFGTQAVVTYDLEHIYE
jgi:hypothetical protein